MRGLYERKYTKSYPDYHSFKAAVLNNNVNPPLPKGMSRDGIVFDTEERFLADSFVIADFMKYDTEVFIDKYCHLDEYGRMVFNDEYPDRQCTVAYCLWLTGKNVLYRGGFTGENYIDKDSTLNALSNYLYHNEPYESNEKQEQEVNEEYNKEYVEMSEQFFLSNQDGYMYYVPGSTIYGLYQDIYIAHYPNYQLFKSAVLNGEISPPLPYGMSPDGHAFDTSCRFLVDSTVMLYYGAHTIDQFLEKYCHNIENGRLLFNVEYPDTRYTIAYCLWLTREYILYKDYYSNVVYIDRNPALNALHNLQRDNVHESSE